jgi:hypothetical protein
MLGSQNSPIEKEAHVPDIGPWIDSKLSREIEDPSLAHILISAGI